MAERSSVVNVEKAAKASVYKFPKAFRLLKSFEFRRVSQARSRYFGEKLVIHYRISKTPRLGLTVTRRFGNAVKRNFFKRTVREAYRKLLPSNHAPIEINIKPQNNLQEINGEEFAKDLKSFFDYATQRTTAEGRPRHKG